MALRLIASSRLVPQRQRLTIDGKNSKISNALISKRSKKSWLSTLFGLQTRIVKMKRKELLIKRTVSS